MNKCEADEIYGILMWLHEYWSYTDVSYYLQKLEVNGYRGLAQQMRRMINGKMSGR